MGRFLSPDDQGGHLADPQTLNKYSYIGNNPLSRTDPTGHDFNLSGCGENSATCQNNLSWDDIRGCEWQEFVHGDSHQQRSEWPTGSGRQLIQRHGDVFWCLVLSEWKQHFL